MTSDPEHPPQSPLYRRGVQILGRSYLECVPVSNDLPSDAEPTPSDNSQSAALTASIMRRRRYDAMLPSLSLPNRSRLRLTFDLIVGIPYVLMLWGIDELRGLPERIVSMFHRAAVANRHEKCRKKHEAGE